MKFSILISAYNIENYIRKCIETCLEQTYKDYEIIVVNDCSTDKTKEILEEYSDKIKIITLPENRGLSYARNIAIEESKGDYICIIDGDDFIQKDYLEKVNNVIETYPNIDIVFFSFIIKRECLSLFDFRYQDFESHLSDNPYEFYDYFIAGSQAGIVKREIYEKIKFPEGRYYEDVGTIYKVLGEAKQVYFLKDPLYIHRNRLGSITSSYNTKKKQDLFDMTFEAWNHIQDKLSPSARANFLSRLKGAAEINNCEDLVKDTN